jgi:RNA polymerase sigma factor (sigma-70 family)
MSSDVDDEATTWSRARDGDGAAFASLFRRHQARVYRRASSMLESAHDAEDVTAATFFELWRKRRTVRVVDGTVLPWLLVTSVNLARNHRRGAGRYRAVIASLPREEATNPESTAVTNIETRLLGVRLTDAVARLSSADAALLALTALDNLSISAAAAAVGIKPGAARMRLHRARLRLRMALSGPATSITTQSSEGDHA